MIDDPRAPDDQTRPGTAQCRESFGSRLSWSTRSESLVAGVLIAAFAATMPVLAAPVISTNLPPVSPLLPEVGFSVIRLFGALALVLALFLVGVWLLKNWQRLTRQRGRATRLEVLEIKALGGRHMLYVVGYQQQRLLLASSPAGVTLVSHLPAPDANEIEPQAVAGPNFLQALQQAVQRKA